MNRLVIFGIKRNARAGLVNSSIRLSFSNFADIRYNIYMGREPCKYFISSPVTFVGVYLK